jgi:CRISPR-associated endonuclease Csn1
MAIGKGSRRRYVNPGSNHHMEIIAIMDSDGNEKKWEGVLVSRFEANQRHKDGRPVIQRNHGAGKLFKFSLTGTEHVQMVHGESERDTYRVTVISNGSIELVHHSDARPITIRKKVPGARVRCSVSRLKSNQATKVAISPAGVVRNCGD